MKSNVLTDFLINSNKKNVAIIGHMGSGKSFFGKKIAKYFKLPHLDSDLEIIKYEKLKIAEIFKNKGEKYFRNIEEKIVKKLLKEESYIISLGGGSILSKEVRKILQKRSFTIFLDPDINSLSNRLKNSSKRPLLLNVNILKKLKELDYKRREYYLKADIIIKNSTSIEKSFLEFKKLLY